MRLAVTGGTGFIGRALLERVGEGSFEVRALTRRPQAAAPGVTWCGGDLEQPEALAGLVTGADAVIHLAGTVSSVDRSAFAAGNVAGTANLLAAARNAGVRRFVFVSSLAAREPGLSAYGASKAEAEAAVMASGLDWIIVRPPAVYGPGDRDMLELFRAAKWGVVPMPRAGRASLIHVDDLAQLLLALVNSADAVGKVFEPDDGRAGGWSHAELAKAIGQAVGRAVKVVGLSPGTLRFAARVMTVVLGAKAKLTPDRAGYMAHPDWVASTKSHVPPEVWRPEVETRAGLRTTAEWYRAQGWL